MAVIVDLVIVGIITICIIIGYVKGLTGSLIKILSFVLSLIIAFILFVPISNFVIDSTQIDENIENYIRGTVNKEGKSEDDNIPETIEDYINAKVEKATEEAKTGVVNSAARDVAVTIVKAGVWISLFIVARIALILLKFITSLIAKLPVIKQLDKTGGVIYGLLEGLVIIYITLAIISFITPITQANLSEQINKSYIGSQMYNHNILLNIIF